MGTFVKAGTSLERVFLDAKEMGATVKRLVTALRGTLWSEIGLPRGYTRMVLRPAIERILHSSDEPLTHDSEDVFEKLQHSYGQRPEYGYDAYSTWRRGTERALGILNRRVELRQRGLDILEVGCGDGMAGFALAGYGQRVTLVDTDDWRDERAKALTFVSADLCGRLPFDSESFDVTYSFNTFEHVSDPGAALAELRRVCRRGGVIFLEFGPLYASPWGLHAYRSLRMPYPQYLFSEPFVESKLAELGIFDLGKERMVLQPLNSWRVDEFRRLWAEGGCDVLLSEETTKLDHLDVIRKFPESFRGRRLTFDDVTTTNLRVLLERP